MQCNTRPDETYPVLNRIARYVANYHLNLNPERLREAIIELDGLFACLYVVERLS